MQFGFHILGRNNKGNLICHLQRDAATEFSNEYGL